MQDIHSNAPVLSRGKLDYTSGRYEARVHPIKSGEGMSVAHSLRGSNLVSSLMSDCKAVFATEVCAPYATYRQLHAAEMSGEPEIEQLVSWSPEDVLPPIYFRPLVIAANQETLKIQLTRSHGVHAAWQDRVINIPKGTILALDEFWRASSTLQSLIRLLPEKALHEGGYRVVPVSAEGYYFRVHMHPELFGRMVNPGESIRQRNTILTACLSRGLELIREKFGGTDSSEDWEQYPTLRALYDELRQLGIPTWEDREFHADEVATRLKPIEFGVIDNR